MSKARARGDHAGTLRATFQLVSLVLLQGACQSPQRSSAPEAQPGAKSSGAPPKPANAPPAAVTSADAPRLEFRPVSSLQALDRAVRDELERRIKEPMADVGEPFQATDVVSVDSPPPTRRFVIAGVWTRSPNLWLLCYEHGGIGYHYHIAMFTIEGGVASVEMIEQWMPKRGSPITLTSVIDALKSNEPQFDEHW